MMKDAWGRARMSVMLTTLVLLVLGVLGLYRFHATAEDGKAKKAHEPAHVRKPLPSDVEIAKLPKDGGKEFNRLVFESSPYLRQHARNPVNWYPWGQEAFERAKKEGKPIFMSVGYSTCHWCHVMERESFENKEIAELLNKNFIAIKLDREERPDIDHIYMTALQAIQRGGGGWPMSMFLFADRKPFFGGTYWPPVDRGGRVGFKTVLTRIHEAWTQQRERLRLSAEQLVKVIHGQSMSRGQAQIGAKTLESGYTSFVSLFDKTYGGFGQRPKFPRSHSLSFLLRYWKRSGDAKGLKIVERTLVMMAQGGMYDHLGGGFHRYSTTRDWLVPHFEKMLYDQALLARTYIEAYQATGKPFYAAIARQIFTYVLRDMTDPKGGFYSAEDADSEGVEGKFYIWKQAELLEVLGEQDGALFAKIHGVTIKGNYSEEATGESTGANILHLPHSLTEAAKALKRDPAKLAVELAAMRKKLFQVREKRVRPYKDDKILTDWNGLMISALAYGGCALGEPKYIAAAGKAADFLLSTMRLDGKGRLLHRYRNGRAGIKAYLDDHAGLLLGLTDLYEATFEARWLAAAKTLAAEIVRLFWDQKEKGFHFAGQDNEKLIARTKQIYDGARPSGNSTATYGLLRLGRLTQDSALEKIGHEALLRFSKNLDSYPNAYPFMLMALDFQVGPTKEVVLAGDPADKGMLEMRRALAQRFLPRLVVALRPTGKAAAAIVKLVPFLANQGAINDRPTAYVCQNYSCKLPTNDVSLLIKQIEGKD